MRRNGVVYRRFAQPRAEFLNDPRSERNGSKFHATRFRVGCLVAALFNQKVLHGFGNRRLDQVSLLHTSPSPGLNLSSKQPTIRVVISLRIISPVER